MSDAKRQYFLVGCYTQPTQGAYRAGEGVALCSIDLRNGVLNHHDMLAEEVNPSYLALDTTQQHLFIVTETDPGKLHHYAFDVPSCAATHQDTLDIPGAHPCHVSVHPDGDAVAVANYSSGSIAVARITPNGQLELTDSKTHSGKGAHALRQTQAHAHYVRFSQDGQQLFTVDLGIDSIVVYAFDSKTGALTEQQRVKLPDGAGPRHLAFHPDGKHVFCVNELDATVAVLTLDAHNTLHYHTSYATLADGLPETNTSAAIKLSNNGSYLYVSNRGHDSVSVFKVDTTNSTLTLLQTVMSEGRTPRDISVTQDDRYLIVANQDSHELTSFVIHQDGQLAFTGERLSLGLPVCVRTIG